MEQAANRQFYSLPEATDRFIGGNSHPRGSRRSKFSPEPQTQKASVPLPLPLSSSSSNSNASSCSQQDNYQREKDLISYVADNIIGSDKTFSGPYGLRTAVYLDFTASGRSLQFIEDYIQQEVLPEYGNTHTTTSITSLQTTLFRHEARDIIRNSCNASEHDSVIFVGSGTTGAVHKLIHSLNFTHSPIVFVGPHEHHSNILPWLDMGAEVIQISSTQSGAVDIVQLESYLCALKSFGRQMVGAFSAASNVTGVLADVNDITITLHRHGALAFWDYAAAAPYIKVDMNPYVGGDNQELVYKDAVYFSVHKFVGGVGCPGVLLMKKRLFRNPVPHGCGGGTVFFVRRDHHRYLVEPEMKEEGGTPDIVGSIRAGLVFQLRDAIGTDVIATRDEQLLRRAISVWDKCPELVLLGPEPSTTNRLPIISFLVHHPTTGRFLHHNFVAAVLNDVLGIQARGGCACAGPYAMDLLGMKEEVSRAMEELLAEDSRLDRVQLRRVGEYSHREILRPGFVRINLPYFLDADGVDFVIEAVRLVSQHAWKLLPQYLFNPETGEWRNKHFQTFKDRKWLGHISYTGGRMSYHQPAPVIKGPLPINCKDCLEKAKEIFSQAGKTLQKVPDQSVMFDEQAKPYRWFLLPSEANQCLRNNWTEQPLSPTTLPFCPPVLLERMGYANTARSMEMETKSFQDKIDEVVDRVKGDKGSSSLFVNQGVVTKMEGEKLNAFSSDCKKCVGVYSCSANNGDGEENSGGRIRERAAESDGHRQKVDNACCVNLVNALEQGFVSNEEENNGCDPSVKDGEPVDGNYNNNKSVISQNDNVVNSDVAVKRHNSTISRTTGEDVSVSHSLSDLQVSHDSCETTHDDKKDVDLCKVISDEKATMMATTACVNSSQRSKTVQVDTCIPCSDSVNVVRKNQKVDVSIPNNGGDDAGKGDNHETGEVKSVKTDRGDDMNNQSVGSSNPTTANNNNNTSLNGDGEIKDKGVKSGKGDKGGGWHPPPKAIFKPAVQALEEYNMIQDGDRVLVCLSGGKDSLSLLHTVRQYQFYAKKKGVTFTFGAVTVDPQTPSYDPSPLKRYLAHLGVPYFYESQCIMETANNLPYECASICSFCSRMKRGRIYAAARREGYNVLALGQHLDDLAESFLMSFLHNGSLNTMKAHYTVKEGDLRVIRPFVYVRETELRSFAQQNKLPVISENCPACFEAPKERHRSKQLLAAQEVIFPQVYSSMMSALKPLMARGRRPGTPQQTTTMGTTVAGRGVGVNKAEVGGDDDDDLDL